MTRKYLAVVEGDWSVMGMQRVATISDIGADRLIARAEERGFATAQMASGHTHPSGAKEIGLELMFPALNAQPPKSTPAYEGRLAAAMEDVLRDAGLRPAKPMRGGDLRPEAQPTRWDELRAWWRKPHPKLRAFAWRWSLATCAIAYHGAVWSGMQFATEGDADGVWFAKVLANTSATIFGAILIAFRPKS